jgi:hypothetical protein
MDLSVAGVSKVSYPLRRRCTGVLRMGASPVTSARGMAELQLVAERGHYLASYARILLAIAYICGKNFTASRQLLIQLRDEFPGRQQGASEETAQTVPSAAFAGPPGGGSNNDHNHHDAVAGLSHGEVRTDHFVDGELAALVTTEPDRGRRTVLQKGDKCDLHRRPAPADEGTQLHHADGPVDGREPRLKGSADENVSATTADHH